VLPQEKLAPNLQLQIFFNEAINDLAAADENYNRVA
jgi:hypothetical protein